MTIDRTTLNQYANQVAGSDPNHQRLLKDMLDRLEAAGSRIDALEAMPAPVSVLLGGAYIFDDDAILEHDTTNAGLLIPDVTQVIGNGVALESFTIGTETEYRAFAVDAGTYYAQLSVVGTSTSNDVHMRSHTAVPSTLATIATDGTELEMHTAAAAQFISALLVATVTTKIWGYVTGGDALGGAMHVHKLA